MIKVYADSEISLEPLLKKRVCIIGFGSQGRAQALNLKDSGVSVCIGLREKTVIPVSPSVIPAKAGIQNSSHLDARNLGFQVYSIKEAVQKTDVVMLLIPDEAHKEVFSQHIKPFLKPHHIVGVSHSYSIVFKTIDIPKEVSFFLVAPKAPGYLVRERFVAGSGVAAACAWSDGRVKDLALSYGKAIGAARTLLFETNFKEEVYSNLFSEQCVLPGGIIEILKKGFEVLVENGVSPLMAYFECFYKLDFVSDLLKKKGLSGMAESISQTASFGALSQGQKVVDGETKNKMKNIFQKIQSGEFAKEWQKEAERGKKEFLNLIEKEKNHPLEKTFISLVSL